MHGLLTLPASREARLCIPLSSPSLSNEKGVGSRTKATKFPSHISFFASKSSLPFAKQRLDLHLVQMDGVSGDILLLTRTWIAIQVTALTVKSALTMQTPLQSRGGQLFQLYKGKGSQALMEKYRSILFADCVGKLSSRSYRTRYTPFIAQAMMDALTWQCGGVPGLGTDFPAITVRLTQHYAESQGKSVATSSVDAKSAFYAVIRK